MSGGTRPADMAASRMGDLLLKGYRMLDASCANCLTVLMQDRSGNNVCVLCAGDGTPKSEERTKLEAAQVEPPAEVAMKEPSSEEVALSAGVDGVVRGVLEEMQAASELLRSHRGIIDYSTLSERQQVLQHIQLCVRVINDLKSIQR